MHELQYVDVDVDVDVDVYVDVRVGVWGGGVCCGVRCLCCKSTYSFGTECVLLCCCARIMMGRLGVRRP